MGQGEFILINCNDIHKVSKTDINNLLLSVYIDLEFYTGIYVGITKLYFECNSIYHGEDMAANSHSVKGLLAQIILELSQQKFGYRARIGSCLFLLMGEIFAFPIHSMADKKGETTAADLARLQRIIEYLNQNLHRKIALKEIAAAEHLSYHYMSHFFRSKLGMSFQDYMTHIRLDKAKCG